MSRSPPPPPLCPFIEPCSTRGHFVLPYMPRCGCQRGVTLVLDACPLQDLLDPEMLSDAELSAEIGMAADEVAAFRAGAPSPPVVCAAAVAAETPADGAAEDSGPSDGSVSGPGPGSGGTFSWLGGGAGDDRDEPSRGASISRAAFAAASFSTSFSFRASSKSTAADPAAADPAAADPTASDLAGAGLPAPVPELPAAEAEGTPAAGNATAAPSSTSSMFTSSSKAFASFSRFSMGSSSKKPAAAATAAPTGTEGAGTDSKAVVAAEGLPAPASISASAAATPEAVAAAAAAFKRKCLVIPAAEGSAAALAHLVNQRRAPLSSFIGHRSRNRATEPPVFGS